jgi:hypothetical protein
MKAKTFLKKLRKKFLADGTAGSEQIANLLLEAVNANAVLSKPQQSFVGLRINLAAANTELGGDLSVHVLGLATYINTCQ